MKHRWGEPRRFLHKTERECLHCGLVKVTRHESDGPRDVRWTEFYRGLDQVDATGTPACAAVEKLSTEEGQHAV